MKGYGLPRNPDVSHPDCADILTYGLQSSFHGGKRNSGNKRKARRIWKRVARNQAKVQIKEQLDG